MEVKPSAGLCFLLAQAVTPVMWCGIIRIGPVYSTGERVEFQIELTASKVSADPHNLWLMEDGVATVVASEMKPARDTQRPLAVILAVDVSGSMKGSPLADTRRALEAHLKDFTDRDSVALVSFGSDTRTDANFGPPQRPELLSALNSLQIRGTRTLLYDALSQCLEQLHNSSVPRRRLIVVSDGWDENSKSRIDDVIQRARQYRIPIDAIGRGKVSSDYANSLYRIAEESGGQYVYAGPGEMSEKMGLVLDRIESMPVAVFLRKVDSAHPATKKVAIEFISKGNTPDISEELAMSIPATLLQTQAGIAPWKILIPIGVILLLVSAVALILVRRKTEKKETGSSLGESGSAGDNDNRFSENLPPPRRRRDATVVDREFVDRGAHRPSGHMSLSVLTGPLKGRKIAIPSVIFRIGADADNDLSIVGDEWVSGHHAQIAPDGPDIVLEDLGSRNGTFVNGQRITSACVLMPDDLIRVGNTELQVMTELRKPVDTVR